MKTWRPQLYKPPTKLKKLLESHLRWVLHLFFIIWISFFTVAAILYLSENEFSNDYTIFKCLNFSVYVIDYVSGATTNMHPITVRILWTIYLDKNIPFCWFIDAPRMLRGQCHLQFWINFLKFINYNVAVSLCLQQNVGTLAVDLRREL